MAINGLLFKKTGLLERSLDASSLRNSVIAENIANIDTPGYKRKTVSFEEKLADAMQGDSISGVKTNSRHIAIGEIDLRNTSISVTEDQKQSNMRLDGNNVDIDSEMALLAKNQIRYNVLVQKMDGEFKKLKTVISERA